MAMGITALNSMNSINQPISAMEALCFVFSAPTESLNVN
jgi:hypothetical protein